MAKIYIIDRRKCSCLIDRSKRQARYGMILIMLKYLYAEAYTWYEFNFLCAFSLFCKFLQQLCIAFIIKKNLLNSLNIFKRWEILHCDFLGPDRTSLTFTGMLQPWTQKRRVFADYFLKTGPRCSRRKAKAMLSFIKKDIETRRHCPALLI